MENFLDCTFLVLDRQTLPGEVFRDFPGSGSVNYSVRELSEVRMTRPDLVFEAPTYGGPARKDRTGILRTLGQKYPSEAQGAPFQGIEAEIPAPAPLSSPSRPHWCLTKRNNGKK